MPSRRLRPVAALTLALLVAPFLAATAVAAQGTTPEHPARSSGRRVTWLAETRASVSKILDRIEAASAAPPAAAKAAPAPPPMPTPDDLATWIWPANGPITSQFGRRWGRMHEGVDIDGPYGSVVSAAHFGTVISAGWENGYGQTVRIDHGNGVQSAYAHLSAIDVQAGQKVAWAQRIGLIGRTGSVTAAHLHYEIRVDGVAKNPAAWLPAGGGRGPGSPG